MTLAEQRHLPILVVSKTQNQAEKLNSLLRAAGHAVRPAWAADLEGVEKQFAEGMPEAIFYFTESPEIELKDLMALRKKKAPAIPVICVTKDATEAEVAAAINQGARDLVSLEHPERLEAVLMRELKVMRQRRELLSSRELVQQYQARFQSLMAESNDAIAYAQDGLHMEANPAWLEMFGHQADEIEGIPVMDLFYPDDQGTLKAALKDLAKGKTVEPLEIRGVNAKGEPFEVKLELSAAELRGEPCVELAIRGDGGEEMQAKVAELAKRDTLTGLFHRHHFVELLADEMDKRRIDVAQAVLFIKPDKFSTIDDKVGPIASDTVLKLFAELLDKHLNKEDIGARFGGNIFTAILTRKNFKEIEAWCDKFCKAVASHVFDAGGQSLGMTASIGIADFGSDATNAGALISLAQQANTQAREAGGNRWTVWTPAETTESGGLSDVGWIKLITTALKQGNFQLAYQPIASLTGEGTDMFDVLVRMLDEDGREIMPNEFMPPAERNGLMVGVDRWIMEKAFKVLAERLKEGKKGQFFLRLSDQSLVDGSLTPWVGKLLEGHKLPPGSIVFQIAETSAESHLKDAKRLSEELRKLKCGVAIEHFGIGNSPLQMLDHLTLDFIKIDGSFMTRLNEDAIYEKVQGLIAKAQEKKIQTVAERVENANTMAVLFQLGVSYIQGNYVHEPEVVMAEDTRVAGM